MVRAPAGPGLTTSDDPVRRLALAALRAVVRGRGERGSPWGEAVLAEFGHTRGRWEAARWAAGGIRAAMRERRAGHHELPRRARIRRQTIRYALTAALAAAGIQQWVLTPQYQPSGAMEPTLLVADFWLMDRVTFRVTGLDYGDVVTRHRTESGQELSQMGRVVGKAGDTIECRAGRVWRNGAAVSEPYLIEGSVAAPRGCLAATVPDGAVYLLGDHREVSLDSEPVVAISQVDGRMVTRLGNAGPDGFWRAPPAATVSAG